MIERSRSMQRRGRTQATMILTLLGLVGSMGGAWAAVNLPVHHWAYDALERLASQGESKAVIEQLGELVPTYRPQ